jgi:hypothetical protein
MKPSTHAPAPTLTPQKPEGLKNHQHHTPPPQPVHPSINKSMNHPFPPTSSPSPSSSSSSPLLPTNNSPLPPSSSTASKSSPACHRHAAIFITITTVGGAASRAIHLHFDRCPDFAAGAGALHQSCGRAEGGKDRLGVAAGVRVGVEFAHDCDWVG